MSKQEDLPAILDDDGYPLHYARDRVLEHYGLDHQVAKLAEESLEVALACYDYLLGKDPEAAGLHEEIPDWKNVGGQVWNGLGLTEDELREREQSKMDRQLHRIADGAGPENLRHPGLHEGQSQGDRPGGTTPAGDAGGHQPRKGAGMKEKKTPQSPCLKCSRRQNCPTICYPRRDYLRAIKKAGRRRPA